jgi:hypothetical protein
MTDDYPKAVRRTAYSFVAVLILLCMVGFALAGCSTTFRGVCAYQPIGMTDSGLQALAVSCETK